MLSEPKYTIEQVELLRRLVRTGLTKEGIIHAVDTMTRLDRELGIISPPYENRVSPIQSPLNPQSSPQSSMRYDIPHVSDNANYSDVDTTTYQLPGQAQNSVLASINRHQDIIGLSKDNEYLINNGTASFKHEECDVSPEEVDALLSRGDSMIREEIKEFLRKNNISQNQLGREIGVTGSYISQYFNSARSMRNSTVILMCKWYIAKKKEIEGLLVVPSISAPHSSHSFQGPIQSGPTTTNRFFPYPSKHDPSERNCKMRKERFVWKENCTKILESYFKKNLYPNDVERSRLAEACKAVQQITEGLPENSPQIVTPERVYHWFANRRKELNKRKRHSSEIRFQESDVDEVVTDLVDTTNSCDGSSAPSINKYGEGESDDDHPGDPKDIANQLQEVNHSILTFMKAVEDKTEQDPECKGSAQIETD